jgi:hypothetical protein
MTKLEVLIERLRRPKKLRRRKKPGYRNCSKAREAKEKQRRERIKQEPWEELILEHRGNVTEIARRMGCCHETACKAIWDLGLWPLLVKVRE